MYRSNTRFTREQLVFVVDAAMCSTIGKIHGCLPQVTSLKDWKSREKELREYIHGVVSHFGIFVPILWAQTEGHRVDDGMGTQEFQGWDEFKHMCDEFVRRATDPVDPHEQYPRSEETRAIAKKIVDAHWSEYFKAEGWLRMGEGFVDEQPEENDQVVFLRPPGYVLTVRFDRATQDNEDEEISAGNFPAISDLQERLYAQFRYELEECEKLSGIWESVRHRVIHENLFCVWVEFRWQGSPKEFSNALQEAYDEHGMAGFYEIIEIYDESQNCYLNDVEIKEAFEC